MISLFTNVREPPPPCRRPMDEATCDFSAEVWSLNRSSGRFRRCVVSICLSFGAPCERIIGPCVVPLCISLGAPGLRILNPCVVPLCPCCEDITSDGVISLSTCVRGSSFFCRLPIDEATCDFSAGAWSLNRSSDRSNRIVS